MTKRTIKVQYIFEVVYKIKEDSDFEARRKILDHCGMVAGKVHSTLPDDEIDWEVDVHPTYHKFVK